METLQSSRKKRNIKDIKISKIKEDINEIENRHKKDFLCDNEIAEKMIYILESKCKRTRGYISHKIDSIHFLIENKFIKCNLQTTNTISEIEWILYDESTIKEIKKNNRKSKISYYKITDSRFKSTLI